IPDRGHSDWAVTLDWYLHFQISKASSRRPHEIPEKLIELARQADVELPTRPLPTDMTREPLLIYSARHLPNRETLHLPYPGNVNDWLKRASEIWAKLGEPSARVFLPRGVKTDHFKGLDSKFAKQAEFVADSKIWN
ncbi:MAG: hypothetical protein ABL958_09755, partial [Bdellovibrionia bacterium]